MLEGRRVHVIWTDHDKVTGKTYQMEDVHIVQKFRRLLPPDPPKQPDRLVQFYAVHGGHRTVRVRDIVDIR